MKDDLKNKDNRKFDPTWLAGIASMGASSICHPLDTIKVRLQTQKDNKSKLGIFGMTNNIIKNTGVLSLYSGLSAALLRQATYSTTRFTFYEYSKTLLITKRPKMDKTNNLPFYQKIILAGIGGGIGSIFGSPNDLVCVRMQNDTQLLPEKRRNYKNCFDGIYKVYKNEGFYRLYTGFHMATFRGILVTIGQLAFYDEFKTKLLKIDYFDDNLTTHFTASMGAGLIATLITMPADVIKTLLMNAKPGEFHGIFHCVIILLKHDKLGLFRGFWPRYIRLGPFTILTFVFYEKLKSLYRGNTL